MLRTFEPEMMVPFNIDASSCYRDFLAKNNGHDWARCVCVWGGGGK